MQTMQDRRYAGRVEEGARPLGLRERKKLETRQALADAAIKLAVERGFDNVTVEDIAARAGVSQRTFFNYFPSKEDAVLRPDADPVAETQVIIDRLNAVPADVHPLRAVATALRPVAERIDREAPEWLTRVSIIESDPALMVKMFTAQKETEQMVYEAIAARVGADPDTDMYPQLLFQTVGAAFRTAMHRWYGSRAAVSATSLFDAAVDQIAAGLPQPDTTPEGRRSDRCDRRAGRHQPQTGGCRAVRADDGHVRGHPRLDGRRQRAATGRRRPRRLAVVVHVGRHDRAAGDDRHGPAVGQAVRPLQQEAARPAVAVDVRDRLADRRLLR
ncbi:hypothetical protein GCM10029964_057240 [Kibdelosporangium lantanae]